ncbi:MAG: hypothetical protein HOD87_09695, partial [Gammaproteobacteria bacterium]|nr:hypothetical protein [Gammaproteobacteria bacterium]
KYYIANQSDRSVALIDCGQEHLTLFADILSKLNYVGFCCVDYKVVGGRAVLLEINARMGFSLIKNSLALQRMLGSYTGLALEDEHARVPHPSDESVTALRLFLEAAHPDPLPNGQELASLSYFDPQTGTLNLDSIDLSESAYTKVDLAALSIVRHIKGHFKLNSTIQIRQLQGLDNLETIRGDFHLANIEAEEILGLNKLREVSGNLVISGGQATEICGFNSLRRVGSLSIENNDALELISGFNRLIRIDGEFLVRGNKHLSTVSGFSALQETGSFEFSALPSLQVIAGMRGLSTIGGSLTVRSCRSLKSVQFLSSLCRCSGIVLEKLGQVDLTALRGYFAANRRVPGAIKISHCSLSSVAFMEGLEDVGSSFYLHYNQLKDLTGLGQLESVGASFSLSSNELDDISQLAKLETVEGMLGLMNNNLMSLHGLENLRSLKTIRWNGARRTLNIARNRDLTDITALSGVVERTSDMIVLASVGQLFKHKPASSSSFASNSVQVFNQDKSLRLASTRVVDRDVATAPQSTYPEGAAGNTRSFFPDLTLPSVPRNIRLFPGVENPIVSAADISDVQGEFAADPFLFKEKGQWYLFYEVMNAETQLGEIGFSTSPNGRDWTYKGIILVEDYHLSYPYVFRYEGKYYMMPESYQANAVKLYQSKRFPYEWTEVSTLLTGDRFVDASVFVHDDKFWMFVSTFRAYCAYLFYSDDLFSGWQEHPRSPFVTEDRGQSRPAGRVLKLKNGSIIRTCQKCDVRYGQQVRAFEVTKLSAVEYEEYELSQSPFFRDSEDADSCQRMHHFDAIVDNDRWYIVTDRKGKKLPWVIELYTADTHI